MCSCLTSFPGFFRYHLPHLKYILSFLSSSFKSLHLSRSPNRSSNPSKTPGSNSSGTRRLATKDIKVTLGSRITGGGRFIDLENVLPTDPDWLPLSEVNRDLPTHADDAREPTRREYYEEELEEQHSQVRHPPSPHDHHPHQSGIRSASPAATEHPKNGRAQQQNQSSNSGNAWWKMHRQPSTTRTGYWDIVSFFRTNTAASGPSKIQSESDSSAV